MPSLELMSAILREVLTISKCPRIPEPNLVMNEPEQALAFDKAGQEGGVMTPVYLYNCANISEILKDGDKVIDLACGPANQLAMVARLNPKVEFTGIDLSGPMLEKANRLIERQKLTNVKLIQSDISVLSSFRDASVEAVMSTMALHHLPDTNTLVRTYKEVARVLKSEGGLYLVDFSHLKSVKSISYFAHQHADRQPEIFTRDYHNSLKAAFYRRDILRASLPLARRAKLYTTFLIPFMVALKSPRRRSFDVELYSKTKEIYSNLSEWQKTDFNDLKSFFRMGGLTSDYLP